MQYTRPQTTEQQLQDFMSALWEPDDIVEIRRLPSGRSTWHRTAELAAPDVVGELLKENAAGQSIYVGANPRRTVGGTKAGDVALARCLFVDLDHMTLEDARQRLQGLPEPTAIIGSGHGFHCYWRLTEPIPDLAAWTAWQKDLIALAGSDPAIHDPPRIMRLPGFLNHKPPAGPAHLVEAHPKRRYDAADLHDVIPHIDEQDPNEPPDAPGKENTPHDQPAPTADAGLERIARAAAWLRKRPGAVEGCTGDSHTYQTACNLVKDFGLSEAEAWPLLQAWNHTCRPPWDENDLRAKLANAISYGKHEKGEKFTETRQQPQQNPTQEAEPPRPTYVSAIALVDAFPTQRETIIEGLLRRGESGTLISAPKMWKSWLLTDIALSVATGHDVLSKFRTRQGRVLYLDYELQPATLAKRIQKVAEASCIDLQELGDFLVIESLRGKRLDALRLGQYIEHIKPEEFNLIVLDPLYRMYPREFDENSNVAMAELFTALQGYAETLNVAILTVHHTSKGLQSEKSITDIGAGAGAQARAADCHLAIRQHNEPNAAVIAGVVRSFAPFEPFALRWEYPKWQLAPDLDPNDLKKPTTRRTRQEKAPKEPPPPKWDVDQFVDAFISEQPRPRTKIIAEAKANGMSHRAAETLLQEAEGCDLVFRHSMGLDRRAHFATIPQPTPNASGDVER